jgi:hypothetical protein
MWSLMMESRSRRPRSQPASPAPHAFRADRLGARRNGRNGHAPASRGRGKAFAVENVTVIHESDVPAAPAAAPVAATPVSDTQHAYEQLAARTREMHALMGRIERLRYERMILRIRLVLDRHVPKGATVAVISRGDEKLVATPAGRAWHFPQAPTGVYAGHHPADSRAAIAHLEELRARGARYLLIPRTAFWWLDHYSELTEYLQRTTCVFREERTCALFHLAGKRKRT